MLVDTSKKPLKIMLLLGAGASKPAGIPTINEMTEEFLNEPYRNSRFEDRTHEVAAKVVGNIEKGKLRVLSEVAGNYYSKHDLEFMMTLLHQLEEERSIEFFETKYPSLKELTEPSKDIEEKKEIITSYRNLIQNYIRNACEKISNVDFLWTLDGLIDNPPLSIFTLNYDGIIENYCEKSHLEYRDGFDPGWNPSRFNDEDSKINLYKLHGSLYWLRTKSVKIVKIPIKE